MPDMKCIFRVDRAGNIFGERCRMCMLNEIYKLGAVMVFFNMKERIAS